MNNKPEKNNQDIPTKKPVLDSSEEISLDTEAGTINPEGAPNAELFKTEDGQVNPQHDESIDGYEGTNYGIQNPEQTEVSDVLKEERHV